LKISKEIKVKPGLLLIIRIKKPSILKIKNFKILTKLPFHLTKQSL